MTYSPTTQAEKRKASIQWLMKEEILKWGSFVWAQHMPANNVDQPDIWKQKTCDWAVDQNAHVTAINLLNPTGHVMH